MSTCTYTDWSYTKALRYIHKAFQTSLETHTHTRGANDDATALINSNTFYKTNSAQAPFPDFN